MAGQQRQGHRVARVDKAKGQLLQGAGRAAEAVDHQHAHPACAAKPRLGAAGDGFLLQLQADILGVPVIRPRIQETTALGAAALAGLATGFWSEADVAGLAGTDRAFDPGMDQDRRECLYRDWQRAVERSLGWAN